MLLIVEFFAKMVIGELSFMPRFRRQQHRDRADMRTLIITHLSAATGALSRTEIARALQRQKALNINSMLEEMTTEGILAKGIRTYRNGVQGYEYWLVR